MKQQHTYKFELDHPRAIDSDEQTTVKPDCAAAKTFLASTGKFDEKTDRILAHTGTCALTVILSRELTGDEIRSLQSELNRETIAAMNAEQSNRRGDMNCYYLKQ